MSAIDMQDRELLELAAKAAGIGPIIGEDEQGLLVGPNARKTLWNPLRFDSDALRLAITCHLSVGASDIAGFADRDDQMGIFIRQPVKRLGQPDLDIFQATRRAIVRAAAEIGKQMPC